MVKRIIQLFHHEFGGLHKAAVILAVSSIFSSILGLLRDRLLAGNFGAGQSLDIYYASFKIPDLLYIISLSVASVTVLIPFFWEKVSVSRKNGRVFLDGVFTFFLLAMVFLIIIVYFLVPFLSDYVAPGFYGEARNQFVSLTRILLLSPLLLGLSNLLSSIVKSYRKFFVYALSPILYNIGIILGIILFFPRWNLAGIAAGVVLGALMHAAIQIPSIVKIGAFPRFSMKINFLEVFRVIKFSLPRTLGLGLNQIVLIFITAVASLLSAGSITIFNLAFNLQSVSLSVIGVSYSVAAFPTLARLFIGNQKKKFLEHTISAMRQIIFWSIPASVLVIVLRAQIVRVILGYGKFGWNDTRLTAAGLGLFAFSVVAQSLVLLFARAFYAAGRTTKPVVVNLLSSFFVIAAVFLLIKIKSASIFLTPLFDFVLRAKGVDGSEMLILPLMFSLGMILNAVVLCLVFQKEFGGIWSYAKKTFSQVVLASLLMGVVTYFSLSVLDEIFNIQTFAGIFFQGLISAAFGAGAWYGVLLSAKNKELLEIIVSIKQKFWKTQAIAPEPEELP